MEDNGTTRWSGPGTDGFAYAAFASAHQVRNHRSKGAGQRG